MAKDVMMNMRDFENIFNGGMKIRHSLNMSWNFCSMAEGIAKHYYNSVSRGYQNVCSAILKDSRSPKAVQLAFGILLNCYDGERIKCENGTIKGFHYGASKGAITFTDSKSFTYIVKGEFERTGFFTELYGLSVEEVLNSADNVHWEQTLNEAHFYNENVLGTEWCGYFAPIFKYKSRLNLIICAKADTVCSISDLETLGYDVSKLKEACDELDVSDVLNGNTGNCGVINGHPVIIDYGL